MFENLYGLSCIENQTLAILRERGIDIRPLYRDCAMPVKELFFFLVYHGNKQEYFDRITRVQDLAREIGIISMELCGRPAGENSENRRPFPGAAPVGDYKLPPKESVNPDEVINSVRNAEENEVILVRVTEEFTKIQLHARGLRGDHYVRVAANGDHFDILNDIPEITLPLTTEEFAAAFGGDFFKLRVNRDVTDADRKKIHATRVFKAENHIEFYFDIADFDPIRRFPNEPEDVGRRMRSMAGVYKTLRYRLAEYYGQYTDTDFIRERMPEAEKAYSLFEYYNLKKNISFERYFEAFEKLNQLDNELMEEIKRRLAENRR